MLTYPAIDPVAISIGPLQVHWYGLMYLIGFLGFWILGRYRAKELFNPFEPDEVNEMVFYGVFGVILGGRIGYVLFYNLSEFLRDPLMLIKVWQGGMSFHGGLLGVAIAAWLFQRKRDYGFVQLMDFVVPSMPVGLGAGRIGNFINGELWGRVTDVPWGMVFPYAGPIPRHPSQLYEALLEGVALFIILWWFSSKPRPIGAVSGVFLIGYGAFRFGIEFFREPDMHIGFVAYEWSTLGQLLTLPMIIGGLLLLWWSYRNNGTSGDTV